MVSKISKFEDGVTVAGTDDLVIARSGNNFRLTATQLNALSLLPANNLSDVDDAATALSNLGGISLTPPRALQLYAANNITVVDPGGNGDYTTLSAAVAAGHGKQIWVFGDIVESSTISISTGEVIRIHLTPGSSVTGDVSIGTMLYVFNDGELYLTGSGILKVDAGAIILLEDTAKLVAYDTRIVFATGAGIAVEDATVDIQLFRVKINRGGGDFGIYFAVPITGTSLPVLFKDCMFRAWGAAGVGAGVAAGLWTDAPFYHCTFAAPDATLPSGTENITFAAGNNTNYVLP